MHTRRLLVLVAVVALVAAPSLALLPLQQCSLCACLAVYATGGDKLMTAWYVLVGGAISVLVAQTLKEPDRMGRATNAPLPPA
jgi:hypothetical protein